MSRRLGCLSQPGEKGIRQADSLVLGMPREVEQGQVRGFLFLRKSFWRRFDAKFKLPWESGMVKSGDSRG